MVQHLTVVDHPLVQHKLTLMRKKTTSTVEFRQLLKEISQFLAYEITRNLPMTTRRIETPIEEMDAPTLDGKKLALISINIKFFFLITIISFIFLIGDFDWQCADRKHEKSFSPTSLFAAFCILFSSR